MTAWVFLIALALIFVVAWIYLGGNRRPQAKIGPDGTNVREPESFVVHHEGKGQGLDIANTALKKRTEHVSSDLPGDTHKLKVAIPGRDAVRMTTPPSDQSRFGDEKVAPGTDSGRPDAESKQKVLSEGPQGSRPETPEEPGSPYAKGRRVTDNHRDIELASELLPNAYPGMEPRSDRKMAASPATTDQEPGYGLGRTAPGETDGEGGQGDAMHADRFGRWSQESSGELTDWSGLNEELPVPTTYGEDVVVALVRNPRSLYVYWELDGHGERNLRSMLGDAWTQTAPCLRIFDITSGAYPGQQNGHSWTILLERHHDHWFVNDGLEPGHRYVVSYERRTPDGAYYLVSHSAPVQMPHEGTEGGGMLQTMYGYQAGDSATSPWR